MEPKKYQYIIGFVVVILLLAVVYSYNVQDVGVTRTSDKEQEEVPESDKNDEQKPVLPINQNLVLKVGESKTVGELTVDVVGITEDSRCPADVQCVWAGRAAIELELRSGGKSTKVIFYSNEDKVVKFEGYTLNFLRIAPDKLSTRELRPGDYTITLNIVK
jgi:hypothetical protein